MKKRIVKRLLLEIGLPIAAGIVVGEGLWLYTDQYLDTYLQRKRMELQASPTAGVIKEVDDMHPKFWEPVYITETKEVEKKTIDLSDEESQMLMKLAMAEAENQGVTGKALVMNVVHNRVLSDEFLNTIEGVIFEPVTEEYHQFSVIDDGRYAASIPDQECYEALEMVLEGWDGSGGALYFEADWNESNWHKNNLEEVLTWQNMIFYK